MKNGNKYTKLVKGNFIKIYINEILHICIPNSKKIIVQTWKEGSSWYCIQIKIGKQEDLYEYDDIEKWRSIVMLLDSILQ